MYVSRSRSYDVSAGIPEEVGFLVGRSYLVVLVRTWYASKYIVSKDTDV